MKGGSRGAYIIPPFIILPDSSKPDFLFCLAFWPAFSWSFPSILCKADSGGHLAGNANHVPDFFLAVNIHAIIRLFLRKLELVPNLHAHNGAFYKTGASLGRKGGGKV